MQTDELYELTDDLLNSNQQVRLKVSGYSMFPLLREGDEIIVSKCNIKEITPGDVVVFKRNSKWIAHRLLKIVTDNNSTTLITKGDSCKLNDQPFNENSLCGKVIYFYRKGNEKKINTSFNYIAVKYPKPFTLCCYRMVWIVSLFKKIISQLQKKNK